MAADSPRARTELEDAFVPRQAHLAGVAPIDRANESVVEHDVA
jgi:hypothetical protein